MKELRDKNLRGPDESKPDSVTLIKAEETLFNNFNKVSRGFIEISFFCSFSVCLRNPLNLSFNGLILKIEFNQNLLNECSSTIDLFQEDIDRHCLLP